MEDYKNLTKKQAIKMLKDKDMLIHLIQMLKNDKTFRITIKKMKEMGLTTRDIVNQLCILYPRLKLLL